MINIAFIETILMNRAIPIEPLGAMLDIKPSVIQSIRDGKMDIADLTGKELLRIQTWGEGNYTVTLDVEDVLEDLLLDQDEDDFVLTVREYNKIVDQYIPVDYFFLEERDEIVLHENEIVTYDMIAELIKELQGWVL